MKAIADFMGVAAAIAGSVALALWIEWASLRGLMRLMPARAVGEEKAGVAAERDERAYRKAA
ncbi:MAG TPA: hypothetical protein VJR26_07695 [Candidatus Acidoferrales bacterium]|nr:hypothetical protein [Candidatus Acidoferrales bacterium]